MTASAPRSRFAGSLAVAHAGRGLVTLNLVRGFFHLVSDFTIGAKLWL